MSVDKILDCRLRFFRRHHHLSSSRISGSRRRTGVASGTYRFGRVTRRVLLYRACSRRACAPRLHLSSVVTSGAFLFKLSTGGRLLFGSGLHHPAWPSGRVPCVRRDAPISTLSFTCEDTKVNSKSPFRGHADTTANQPAARNKGTQKKDASIRTRTHSSHGYKSFDEVLQGLVLEAESLKRTRGRYSEQEICESYIVRTVPCDKQSALYLLLPTLRRGDRG